MVRINIKHHGRELQTLELEQGREYFIGRDPSCDIVIDGQKGISRQHARLYFDGNNWVVTLISKFGSLIADGQAAEALALEDGAEFSIPPFSFHLEGHAQAASEPRAPAEEDPQGPAKNPMIVRPTQNQNREANFEHTQTSLVAATAAPFIRVANRNAGGREEVFRLEGNAWTVGRDPSCEVPVDNPHISRRHLEISRTFEGYFVTDLGSANGTTLNGETLTPHEPIQIVSGDILSIMNVQLHFEIRDSSFDKRVSQLPQNQFLVPLESLDQFHAQVPAEQAESPYLSEAGPAVLKVDRPKIKVGKFEIPDPRHIDYRKHKVRVAIGVLSMVFFVSLFTGNDDGKKDQSSSSGGEVKFENLTTEQKSAVKDALNLASNLYVQGKYGLCSEELKKLHAIVPFYENSKELETFCAQGQALISQQQYNEQLKLEQERAQQFIAAETDRCRNQFPTSTSEEEMRTCLGPALERDPQHPLIVGLLHEVSERQLEHKRRMDVADERERRKAQTKNLFNKAMRYQNEGQLAKAIQTYETLLSGEFPEYEGLKQKAGREVANVKQQLGRKVSGLLTSCKQNLEQSKFKAAYLDCEQASKEDPRNKEASQMKSQALSEMKRELKSVYEDSVIEENLGNIDVAKDKWKKIVEDDLPNGEYAKKAKANLRKYGIGL